VRVPGGLDPATGMGLKIFGAPRFAAGERALLFLREAPDGSYRILHLMLGAFHRRDVAGRKVALRDLSDAHEVEVPDGRAGGEDDLRDFEGFSTWVEERGEGVRAPRGYVVGKAAAGLAAATAELAAKSGYTLLLSDDNRAIRWFGFDSGAQVDWHIHAGGQPGLGETATAAAFQRALAAWNDDPGTNVALRYVGTNNAGGGLARSDDVNTLLFDDPYRDNPNEAVEGTFDCRTGGVIAMGGPFFFSGTKTWNGQRFHEAAEGDIVTNDGTECFFANNPSVAAEVFAHELGHTLGLGHSTNRDALMYANVHDDGRGATLTADDRAAIAALYGGGSGGGGGTSGGAGLAMPRRLAAQATSPSSVRLSWRDRASRETNYVVELRRRGGAWTTAAVLGANTTTTAIRGLGGNTWYAFRVRAVSGGASSDPSNVVAVVTPR